MNYQDYIFEQEKYIETLLQRQQVSTETQNVLRAMMVYFKNSREKQDHVIDFLKAIVDSNRKEFKRCEELLQKQAHL